MISACCENAATDSKTARAVVCFSFLCAPIPARRRDGGRNHVTLRYALLPSTEPSTVNSVYIGFRRRGAPPPRNPAYAQDRCRRRPSRAIHFAGGAARPAEASTAFHGGEDGDPQPPG